MQISFSTLDKWIPYRLTGSDEEVFCEWLYTGNEHFRASFFDHTISSCKQLPENAGPQKNITSIARLMDWADKINVEDPTAIVFHVSRCGSTIVAQAFANDVNHIVLSEVPFFDDVLRTTLFNEPQRDALLKAAIKLYSLPRNGHGSKVFIKTDSWHVMFYSKLRQMFAAAPFILLYRNPVEVVRSQNKKPGWHCIPQFVKPEFFGIEDEVITAEDFYNYPIKVMEKYLEAFVYIAANDGNAFLFDYKQGMLTVTEEIYKTIDMPFTADERAKMEDRLKYHSKYPGAFFSPEPEMQKSDEKFLKVFKLYTRLEELRQAAKL